MLNNHYDPRILFSLSLSGFDEKKQPIMLVKKAI